MLKIKFLFIFLFASLLLAQNSESWRIFSSMKNINDVAVSESGFWAVTDGGPFKYTLQPEEYTVLSKADGLNSQLLTSVAIDNAGDAWFGSQEGYIIIYNNTNKTVKNILDIFKTDKSRKQINSIYIKGDTAFVATDFGLSLLNTNNYSFYDSFLKFGEFNSETKIMNALKTNRIFVCTEDGVAVQKAGVQNISPESWESYRLNSAIQASSVAKIIDYKGQILIATNNGIFSFTNNSWQPFLMQGSIVNDITANGDKLYITTNNSVIEYSQNQTAVIFENSSLTLKKTITLNNKIYSASNSGIIAISSTGYSVIKPAGPENNFFVNMSVDQQSRLWIATGKDVFGIGFMEYDGDEKWQLYNKENYPQLPSNFYYNVFAGNDNTVYLSNWGSGVTLFKDGGITVYNNSNSPLSGIPVAGAPDFVATSGVKTDSKGNMWTTTFISIARKHLSVLTKDNKWYTYSITSPVTLTDRDAVDILTIDTRDTKWFAVTDGRIGLYYYNENSTFENTSDDKQGYLTTSDGLPSSVISSLAVDLRGQLWIGTNQGLAVINNTTLTGSTSPRVSSNVATSLRGQIINCIAVDPLDQKWVGTNQGLFVLSADGVALKNHYNSNNSPLPNNVIKSLAIDGKTGKVYIGTDFGLAALQTSSIEPKESFEEVFVYPNPYVIGGNSNINLTIEGLIRNSNLKIFDITGKLIKDFISPGGMVAFWDGRDLDGRLVPSGVYVIVAYDSEANSVATAKVAVIRK